MSAGATALLLATHNDHKRREFARLLPGVAVDTLPDGLEAPEETGDSYAENALIKARAAAEATGRVAVADDSGVEAAALDGRPGVRSARYAGDDATDGENLAKLQAEVPAGTPLRYVCVIARVTPGGDEELFEGTCEGVMAPAARGERGFGYDPVFVPEDDVASGRTMAELTDEEKDAISHRGRAARALLARLTV